MKEGLQGVFVFLDELEKYSALTDEQYGRLCRARLNYARTGYTPELNPPESYFFPMIMQEVTRASEKTQEIRGKRQAAANAKWEKEKQNKELLNQVLAANGSKSMQMHAEGNLIQEQDQEQDQDLTQDQEQDQDLTQDQDINLNQSSINRLIREGYHADEINTILTRAKNKPVKDWYAYLKSGIDQEREKTKKAHGFTERDWQEPAETPEQMLARYTAEMDGGGDE